MVSDRYSRCSTSALVRKLGHKAPLHAFAQAHKRLEASDLEGFAAWNRIMVATKDLLNEAACGDGPSEPEAAADAVRLVISLGRKRSLEDTARQYLTNWLQAPR